MLNQSGNQLAAAGQMLIFGAIFGAIYVIIREIVKAVFNKKRAASNVFTVIFGIVSGIAMVFKYDSFTFTEYRAYIPLTFIIGFLMAAYAVTNAVAYSQNVLYNIFEKFSRR